ncbi:MAG TPA: phosphate ABC transporter permease subunit PstC [Bacillota bacterium]|jgi:phosphate transport system permease protein
MNRFVGPRRSPLKRDRGALWRGLFLASAVFLVLSIGSIVFLIGRQAVALFSQVSPVAFLFGRIWAPDRELYGVLPFLIGSLWATAIALAIGGPLGLAGAVFLAKIATPRAEGIVRPAIQLLAGIPSVVFGWIGLTALVPFIRVHSGHTTGFGLLAAGVVLAVMILPTFISLAEDALRSLSPSLEQASLALGTTRWQTIWYVLLPAAWPGIIAAVILSLARAIGETMAVQMVLGNSPVLPDGLITPASTLTSEIMLEMGSTPHGSPANNALFAMGLLLLLFSIGLIAAVRATRKEGNAVVHRVRRSRQEVKVAASTAQDD